MSFCQILLTVCCLTAVCTGHYISKCVYASPCWHPSFPEGARRSLLGAASSMPATDVVALFQFWVSSLNQNNLEKKKGQLLTSWTCFFLGPNQEYKGTSVPTPASNGLYNGKSDELGCSIIHEMPFLRQYSNLSVAVADFETKRNWNSGAWLTRDIFTSNQHVFR